MSRAAEAAMAASYKQLKEDFVSGLTGGDILEINYVTAVASVSSLVLEYYHGLTVGKIAVVLWSALQTRQSLFHSRTPLTLAVDFLLNVGATLLAFTLYADSPLLLNLLILAPAVLIYLIPQAPPPKKQPKLPPSKRAKQDVANQLPKKPFLTMYRGSMMIATCLGILAVDFKVFPRRFAKVETWGTSLMDVGVGSFVFSAGIVAARTILKEKLEGQTTALSTRLYGSIRHSLPLMILGLVRLYSVKGLDYAEHVTEYGVHWNFFFTLGLLPPFMALCQSIFKYLPSYAGLAIVIGAAYQIALETTSLKAIILAAPRTNLFLKNREGIFSFFGYLAIFLAGESAGMFLLPRHLSSSPGVQQRKRLLLTLGAWSAMWTLLFIFATSYHYGLSISISRRLANLPYFLWIVAFNSVQLSAFCLVETIFFPEAYKSSDTSSQAENEIYKRSTSSVLEAFNRNGLAIFLAANLLTGVVNLTVPTLHVSNVQAMGILIGYAATLTGLAVGLDVCNISIKM
jgi:glucosaminylphosphatidylinositol acyltransferase